MDTIVVGVDGSSEARRAVQWAVEEARIRSGRVLLVHAFESPVVLGSYNLTAGGVPTELLEDARKRAEQLVDDALEGIDTEGVEVFRDLAEDVQPAQALIDRAKDATLLVVGSRGRGGFRGLLLGSVSQQAVHHAGVPVVVIPHEH